MSENIIYKEIKPYKPKILEDQQITVYVGNRDLAVLDLDIENGEGAYSVKQKNAIYTEVVAYFTSIAKTYLQSIGVTDAIAQAQGYASLDAMAETVAKQTLSDTFCISSDEDLVNEAKSIGSTTLGVGSKNYSMSGFVAGLNALAGNVNDPSDVVAATAIGKDTQALGDMSFAGGEGAISHDKLGFSYGKNVEAYGRGFIVGTKENYKVADFTIPAEQADATLYMERLISARQFMESATVENNGVKFNYADPTHNDYVLYNLLPESVDDEITMGHAFDNAVVFGNNVGAGSALINGDANWSFSGNCVINGSQNISFHARNVLNGLHNFAYAAMHSIISGAYNVSGSHYSINVGRQNETGYGTYLNAIGALLNCQNSDGTYGKLVVGSANNEKTNTIFEVGNGELGFNEAGGVIAKTRSNAFEVLKDGRAKAYGTPVEDNDVTTVEWTRNWLGFLGEANTWTAPNTFNGILTIGSGTIGKMQIYPTGTICLYNASVNADIPAHILTQNPGVTSLSSPIQTQLPAESGTLVTQEWVQENASGGKVYKHDLSFTFSPFAGRIVYTFYSSSNQPTQKDDFIDMYAMLTHFGGVMQFVGSGDSSEPGGLCMLTVYTSSSDRDNACSGFMVKSSGTTALSSSDVTFDLVSSFNDVVTEM